MIFRNPWIDPRILEVRPEAVRAYLLAHAWEYLEPAIVPDLLMFDTPQPRGDKPNVLLPVKLEHGYLMQRMVELVTEVALYEDRWAVDVLSDMIRQPIESVPANGPALPSKTDAGLLVALGRHSFADSANSLALWMPALISGRMRSRT